MSFLQYLDENNYFTVSLPINFNAWKNKPTILVSNLSKNSFSYFYHSILAVSQKLKILKFSLLEIKVPCYITNYHKPTQWFTTHIIFSVSAGQESGGVQLGPLQGHNEGVNHDQILIWRLNQRRIHSQAYCDCNSSFPHSSRIQN